MKKLILSFLIVVVTAVTIVSRALAVTPTLVSIKLDTGMMPINIISVVDKTDHDDDYQVESKVKILGAKKRSVVDIQLKWKTELKAIQTYTQSSQFKSIIKAYDLGQIDSKAATSKIRQDLQEIRILDEITIDQQENT